MVPSETRQSPARSFCQLPRAGHERVRPGGSRVLQAPPDRRAFVIRL